MTQATDRLCRIDIDDSAMPPPTPEMEQDRRVAVFDLLELADLLPDSYLTEVRERLSGDRAAPPIPTSPTEATA